MMKKRIDVLLVERGLAESRNRAQRLVMAGEVRVDGEMVHKSSTQVKEDADIMWAHQPGALQTACCKMGLLKSMRLMWGMGCFIGLCVRIHVWS